MAEGYLNCNLKVNYRNVNWLYWPKTMSMVKVLNKLINNYIAICPPAGQADTQNSTVFVILAAMSISWTEIVTMTDYLALILSLNDFLGVKRKQYAFICFLILPMILTKVSEHNKAGNNLKSETPNSLFSCPTNGL